MKKLKFLKAILILALYMIAVAVVFLTSVTASTVVAYGAPMLLGATASLLFLYFFDHDGLFAFAKQLEKLEEDREEKFIARFSKKSRIVTTILIGIVGGPIFASLSTHLLLHRYRHKYLLVMLINIPSTILTIGGARGLFSFIT